MVRKSDFIQKMLRWGGNRRDIENVQTHTRRITEDEKTVEMVTLLYHLLAYTDYLNPIAYEHWVMDVPISKLARREKKAENALYQTLFRQRKKLESLITDDLFEIIKRPGEHQAKIDYYHMIFMQLNQRHKTEVMTSISHLFTFDIQELAVTDLQYNFHVTAEEFDTITQILQMTVKPYLNLMLEEVDPRFFGYVAYLMQGDQYNLTDRDMARKKHLEELWLLNI